jgi:hypothetical protein
MYVPPFSRIDFVQERYRYRDKLRFVYGIHVRQNHEKVIIVLEPN